MSAGPPSVVTKMVCPFFSSRGLCGDGDCGDASCGVLGGVLVGDV